MKAALITGSFWELYIFIKQLNKKWNFLYVKDQENKRELHKDASVSKHFRNAGTRAPTRFLFLLGENAGKWNIPQEKTDKLPTSYNSKLAANTCLGKIILEGKMSQMYKLTLFCSRNGKNIYPRCFVHFTTFSPHHNPKL